MKGENATALLHSVGVVSLTSEVGVHGEIKAEPDNVSNGKSPILENSGGKGVTMTELVNLARTSDDPSARNGHANISEKDPDVPAGNHDPLDFVIACTTNDRRLEYINGKTSDTTDCSSFDTVSASANVSHPNVLREKVPNFESIYKDTPHGL